MMIMDAGIKIGDNAAYSRGMAETLFTMQKDGKQPLQAKVWPGPAVFPDWLNPNATSWWQDQWVAFQSKINFLGAWLDMNEVRWSLIQHCKG